MCPVCVTTAALTAAGTVSTAGVMALVVGRWRSLRLWLGGSNRD
jgi:hypothetical protein